jgi:hypothetical protein
MSRLIWPTCRSMRRRALSITPDTVCCAPKSRAALRATLRELRSAWAIGQPIVPRAVGQGELFGERQLRRPHERNLRNGAGAPQVLDVAFECPADKYWIDGDLFTSRSRLNLHGVLRLPRPSPWHSRSGSCECSAASRASLHFPTVGKATLPVQFRRCAAVQRVSTAWRPLDSARAQTLRSGPRDVNLSDILIRCRTGSIPTCLGTAASCGSSLT